MACDGQLQAVREPAVACEVCICRSTWIYSAAGALFVTLVAIFLN